MTLSIGTGPRRRFGGVRRQIAAALTALCVSLVLLGTVAAQQVKRTRTAEVTAQTLVYDWNTNDFELTGNCRLVIGGGYDAQMSAPHMTVKLNDAGDRIMRLVAQGVVKFNIVTKPDAKGTRRKIVASAQKQAVYSEVEQTVELTGGAEADLTTLGADGQAAHFTGEKITANLQTSTLVVDDANLKLQTPLEE